MKLASFIFFIIFTSNLPIEHGDQQINSMIKKNLDLERAKQVVTAAKKHNIDTYRKYLGKALQENSGNT